MLCANRLSASSATVNTTATGDTNIDWTNWQEGKNRNVAAPSTTPTYAAITARSYFANSVNVSMIDGSVRSIRMGATDYQNLSGPLPGDWNAFQYLAGMRDGQINPSGTLIN